MYAYKICSNVRLVFSLCPPVRVKCSGGTGISTKNMP